MIDARVPAAPPWARFRGEPLADVVSCLFEEFELQRVDDDLDVLLREPPETLLLELAKRLASGPRSEAELGAFADGSARLRPSTGSDARDRERRALHDLLVPRDGPAVQSCFRLGLPAHHRSQARPWRPAAASGDVVEPDLGRVRRMLTAALGGKPLGAQALGAQAV